MKTTIKQLDQHFRSLGSLANSTRPAKGWLRAIREAMGMTTTQFARRLDIAQPSAIDLEKSEASNSITLKTLQRAAEALGCRVIYVVVPKEPLEETLRARSRHLAEQQLKRVEHTMRLENQSVRHGRRNRELRDKLAADLLKKPARLWDDL